jgi:fibro-slime domain-containing protein
MTGITIANTHTSIEEERSMSTSAISRSVGAPVLSGCRTFLTGAVVLLAGASCTNATVSSPAPIAGNGQGGDQGGNIVDPNGGGGGCIVCAATGGTGGTPITKFVAPKNCGDGVVESGEGCDDGNTLNGDGCNALCQIEANYKCPTAGQPCINMAVCGNGILTSNEACDDGNTVSGDGCSGDCKTIEPGWQCRMPGKPCTPQCGDGVITSNEMCDDGNTVSGDGCSATCKIEIGYTCSGQPSVCTKTTCGDGKVEGAEGCDDGNTMPFDGCSEDCQLEPNCAGASCTSKCGDGIVVPPEQCDDGNAIDGDGCSKTCQIEAGWTCTQPALGNKMMVPILYRDFRFKNPPEFEAGVLGQDTPFLGIVQSTLDSDGKPVYSGIGGGSHITSTATFAEWYRTTPGVNDPTASKLALWDNGQGAYVNRYGPNGEQWNVTTTAYWCGSQGSEIMDPNNNPEPCTFQYQQSATNPTAGQTDCQKDAALGYTMLNCYLSGTTYMATFVVGKVDGNPLFFPIDADPFSADQLEAAQVPSVPAGLYDATGTWPWDVDAAGNKRMHNFSFTSEVRYWFLYDKTKSYTLDFTGDDDVWVFINKQLAVDLGGVHTPVSGSVTLSAATASTLNLSDGKVYEIAVFQTERQTTGSTYKLTLNGFNAAPSTCVPTCGDGITVGDEECDCGSGTVAVPAGCSGPNSDSTYGGCTTKCTWGPFCGDGIVQAPQEQCDLGKLNGSNNAQGGCTFGCTKSDYCGDGIVDTNLGEQCDLAALNGVPLDANGNPTDAGGTIECTSSCQIPIINR